MRKGKMFWHSRLWWVPVLLLLIALNYLASIFHALFDLTKEKRYTLSSTTRELVKGLEEDVEIDVFLTGEFPSGFRKLQNSTTEFLRLLKDRNGSRIHYRFISPTEPIQGARITYGDSLVNLGAVPINLTVQKEAGESSNIIFPVALMRYNGKEELVSLYPKESGFQGMGSTARKP